MRTILRAAFVWLFLVGVAAAETISVSAAVSLKEAVTDAAKAYEAGGGDHVDFNFGSSGELMAQLKNGAPVDVFISAANKQVDELSKAGLVDDSSRRIIAGNELVLIVPADSTVAIKSFQELGDASIKRFAMGEPKSVPAGQYTAQVLKTLKLDAAMADRTVYGTNVRQVLTYIEQDEATAGVVYATDARESGTKVKVIATADPQWHEGIVYPGVVMKSSGKSAAAKEFLDFLASDKGQKFLTDHGFTHMAPTTQPSP